MIQLDINNFTHMNKKNHSKKKSLLTFTILVSLHFSLTAQKAIIQYDEHRFDIIEKQIDDLL